MAKMIWRNPETGHTIEQTASQTDCEAVAMRLVLNYLTLKTKENKRYAPSIWASYSKAGTLNIMLGSDVVVRIYKEAIK